MSWRTTKRVVVLRGVARRLGVSTLIQTLRREGYEERFQERILKVIRAGDTVWDVGANVGYYTERFAARVGSSGRVIAIEPNPSAVEELRMVFSSAENVVIIPMGLGNCDGSLRFDSGPGLHSTTGRIMADGEVAAGGMLEVEIARGDSLIADGMASRPNVIKIDTEGCELEVLEGLQEVSSSEALRAIGVEVHFGRLSERGLIRAPAQIESLLLHAGFLVTWPDPSHLLAIRAERRPE